MTDIVERLRDYDKCTVGPQEAADEILRLRAHNEKILDGMRDIIRERDILSGENYDLRAENEKLKKELDFAIKGVEKYEAIIDAAKEQAKDDLSKKLREANGYLFRDWKENARLMWQAAEEIEKLRREAAIRIDQIEREQEAHLRTISDYNRAMVKNDKLHKALKPFARIAEDYEDWETEKITMIVLLYHLRAAAAAIRESSDERPNGKI